MKPLQVSLIHMQISESPAKNLETAEKMLYRAADSGSKFICLPEYFAFPESVEDKMRIEKIAEQTYKPAVRLLKRVSKDVDAYIVGGTIFEKFRGDYYNTCLFLKNGEILGKFRKMHLTDW